MKLLVTGGAGFIGTNLARRLVSAGTMQGCIRVFDNLSTSDFGEYAALGIEVEEGAGWSTKRSSICHWHGDITNQDDCAVAFEGADAVVHLAASAGVDTSVNDPLFDATQNVLGTLNCLRAAQSAGVKRFVLASSNAPLGAVEPPVREDLPAKPLSPYGVSKLAGEGYCSAFFHTFGVEAIALRFSNVYGPYSAHKSSVVAAFIKRALDDGEVVIFGDGQQTRDLIFVDDLVAAIHMAAVREHGGGEVVQIGTGIETSVLELVSIMQAAFAERGLPAFSVVHAPPRLGDARRNYSDITKARQVLDWSPNVDLEAGLRATLDWYLERQKSKNSTI